MKSLGQTAYEAYCEKTGWKSLATGVDLPQWGELKIEIKEAWEASASAVSQEVPRYLLGVPEIARVCHEVNRAYGNRFLGDEHKPWDEAPVWQKESAMKGVQFLIDNPDVGPEGCHNAWYDHRASEGWQWGPVKDEQKKEHPCMVSFVELPAAQQTKDVIFQAIVRNLLH